ncbi:MAG: hypothetical protein EXR64_01925 [Dehalococcoidia bacterium]|nr:hypothetical protein [Dehalococcoidia bacterium]
MARVATPLWVTALVARILEDEGRRRGPVVDWRTRGRVERNTTVRVAGVAMRRGEFSRGQWDLDETITVWSVGRQFDATMVLLHELAHWLTRAQHTRAFWAKTWSLYARHLPRRYWRYALEHEGEYRAWSIDAAAALEVPRARELIAKRRAARASRA